MAAAIAAKRWWRVPVNDIRDIEENEAINYCMVTIQWPVLVWRSGVTSADSRWRR